MKAAALLLAAGTLLVGAACSNGNKAGGGGALRTIVLTFASQFKGGQPDQLARFASEVTNRSHGTIQIDFRGNWRANDPHQELDTIRDVRAGKADLAWVGARAWDWVGVRSFDALVAPLLVDSLPIEKAVFAAGIPQRMLPGVRRAGVVGIGILPGPMRKALGVHRRLTRPADFRGLVFGLEGIVAAETLRALGARPQQLFAMEPLTGLGGVESQMSAIEGNNYDKTAHYLSANLNLWPRPLVLFASPRIFRSLTSAQRQTLLEAAAAAVPEAMAASEQEDAAAEKQLCTRNLLAFVDLTASQLEGLRAALTAVYRRLERDPSTRRAIGALEALRRKTPGPPPLHCAGSSAVGTAGPTPIDGSWQMTVNQADLLGNPAYGHPVTAQDVQPDIGTYRYTFHDGRLEFSHSHDTGTYRIHGDLAIFHITGGHDVGETWSYRWSVYHRDQLTFSRPPANAPQGPPNPMFAPWRRVAGTPKQAKPLNGVYEVDTTSAQLAAAGGAADGELIPENWGHWVYIFAGNRLAFTQQDSAACTWAYGRVHVHGHVFSWNILDGGFTKSPDQAYNKPGEAFEFRWDLYRDTLTLSRVPGTVSPTNFLAEPWHRLSTRPSRSYFSKDCPPPKAALP